MCTEAYDAPLTAGRGGGPTGAGVAEIDQVPTDFHTGLSPLEARIRAAQAAGEATCLGCGCTDSRACDGGCGWVLVDRRRGIGVCTACEVVSRPLPPEARS